MFLDVLPEGAGEFVGLGAGELRPQHRVLGHGVYGLLVGAVDFDERPPQFRVGDEGLGRGFQQLPLRLGDGLLGRVVLSGGRPRRV